MGNKEPEIVQEEKKPDYKKYINENFYEIKKEYSKSLFSKYKMDNILHDGDKKMWKTFSSDFTNEELLEYLVDMWLIIRPMDIEDTLESCRFFLLGPIESIHNNIKGNQGISTIPHHWGLVFRTEKNNFISLQYPPVTLLKAENKEHAILQILNGCKKRIIIMMKRI